MRRPREYGWRTSDGITHHIDTRRYSAFHADERTGTCGVDLRQASRARFDSVDCITCIVRVARRPRLPPRPTPSEATPSWGIRGGDRHARSADDPWRAVCGISLRKASPSGSQPNCLACGARPGTHSWKASDGIRHTRIEALVPVWKALCGSDLSRAQVSRQMPNCDECHGIADAAKRAQKGRNRGRQLPRAQRR